MAARFVHAGGDLLRRRLEAASVEVPEHGHEGVPADVAAAGDQAVELEPGPLANGGGGREGGEVVEEEGALGGEDVAVDADGGAALPRGERDLGVGAVEEGRVKEALEVVAEVAQPDGLELRQSGLRRRGRSDKDGG